MCSEGGSALATAMIDNERVRVTEWRFKAPGDSTGWHRHEYDYVVVPLFDGFLEIHLPGGDVIQWPVQNGVPYYKPLGAEHDVINPNNFECAFVEIELLEAPRPAA